MFKEAHFPSPANLQVYLEDNEEISKITEDQDYGYQIIDIDSPGKEPGDSVLLVMPARGCAVEPVTLIGNKTLVITPKSGRGKIIVARAGKDKVEVFEDGESTTLRPGDTYGYINVGEEPYIVRDDCTPTFKPEDEVALIKDQDRPIPAAFLAEYRLEE